MEKKMKLLNVKLNESLYDSFQITTIVNKTSMTKVVEEYIRNYTIINKSDVNDYILKNANQNNG